MYRKSCVSFVFMLRVNISLTCTHIYIPKMYCERESSQSVRSPLNVCLSLRHKWYTSRHILNLTEDSFWSMERITTSFFIGTKRRAKNALWNRSPEPCAGYTFLFPASLAVCMKLYYYFPVFHCNVISRSSGRYENSTRS